MINKNGSGDLQIINVSNIKNKYLDIPYADASDEQKLDLYLPETGKGPFPLIIHIHGGAFRMGDKRDEQVLPWLGALKMGYAVASINYRLSWEAIFPAAVYDCKAAIRFLKAKSKDFNIQKEKIAVVGGSAGGNLSEMIAVSANIDDLSDLSMGNAGESCEVQAMVAWFGPTDFLQMDEQLALDGLGPLDHNDSNSPESEYMGGKITELDSSWVQKANPMSYIHPGIPPMFIQHGDKDHLVPWRQSKLLVDKIEKELGPGRVKFEILHGADHADKMFVTDENMKKVFDFLDLYLKE